MKITIKSKWKDWTGAFRIIHASKKQARKGKKKITPSNINKVANQLHPGMMKLKVVSISEASKNSKTFRFVSLDKEIPYFEAGQYMTLATNIGDSFVSRPYSISSAPYQALLKEPFIEVTVKKAEGNFFSSYLLEKTDIGDIFYSQIGLGDFVYDEIRDRKEVVALAGGSGITPFYSMAKEIEHGDLDIHLTILYGSRTVDAIVLKDRLDEIKSDKVKVIHVLSDEIKESYEHGFISKEIIAKYANSDCSFFICGPSIFIEYAKEELNKLNVPYKRIRSDYVSQPRNISTLYDYPQDKKNQTFTLIVHQGIDKKEIPCNSDESILVALERAGIHHNNACRAGYCGFCRCKLVSGDVYIYSKSDWRRETDKEYNYIHACSSYPLSDVEIRISIGE